MDFCTPLLHLPVASVYFGGLDYTVTHFIRELNDNPVLNTLFTWFTFTARALSRFCSSFQTTRETTNPSGS